MNESLNALKEFQLQQTYDKDHGFRNIKGVDALNRKDGMSLSEEYGQKFQVKITEISDTLGNDAQKQAFLSYAAQMKTNYTGQITAHEADEFKHYSLSVSEGVIQTAINEAELSWNQPEVVFNAMQRIHAEVYRQAHLEGKSAEWQTAQARNLTSHAHKVVLMSAMQNHALSYANQYLNKFSKEMTAEDALVIRGKLMKENDAALGQSVAAEVLQNNQMQIQPNEIQRAFNILNVSEQAKDGEWGHFQQRIKTFNGNLAQVYAAQLLGDEHVQKAIKKSQNEKSASGNWFAYLPDQTQNQVRNQLKSFNAGMGKPPRPSLYALDVQLKNDKRLANNPEALHIARHELSTSYDIQTKALQQQDAAFVADAMRGLVENGGHYSALPVAVRAQIPPEQIEKVMNFATRVNKGDNTTSLWLYNKLTSNPSYLKSLSDDQFYALRSDLSADDFMHFSRERAKLNGEKIENSPDNVDTQAVRNVLNIRLKMLKIDLNPKQGSANAERLGAIQQTVNQQLLIAQKNAGHKFNEAEITQFIDSLFSKNTLLFGWISSWHGAILDADVDYIPKKDKKAIQAAFEKQGIDHPTDGQILNAWHNMRLK